jgi:hypothetical protein
MGPGWFLPISTLLFGVASIATAFVNTIHQASGVRFVLGIFEAGMVSAPLNPARVFRPPGPSRYPHHPDLILRSSSTAIRTSADLSRSCPALLTTCQDGTGAAS